MIRARPKTLVSVVALAVATQMASTNRCWALNPAKTIVPERPTRSLLTGGLVLLDSWKPLTPQIGGLFQVSMLPTDVTNNPDGSQQVQAPHGYLHLSAALGYRFLQTTPQLCGLGQLGAVWRTGGAGIGWVSAAGVVAGFAWPQRQLGPLARIEIIDNLGLYGGPLFGWTGSTSRLGGVVGIDYMRDILSDLGLK